jgi:hypothetical protein
MRARRSCSARMSRARRSPRLAKTGSIRASTSSVKRAALRRDKEKW